MYSHSSRSQAAVGGLQQTPHSQAPMAYAAGVPAPHHSFPLPHAQYQHQIRPPQHQQHSPTMAFHGGGGAAAPTYVAAGFHPRSGAHPDSGRRGPSPRSVGVGASSYTAAPPAPRGVSPPLARPPMARTPHGSPLPPSALASGGAGAKRLRCGDAGGPSPRRKGVTFEPRVLVREYTIGHTVDGYSQSFTLGQHNAGSLSAESAHRRQGLLNPYRRQQPLPPPPNSAATFGLLGGSGTSTHAVGTTAPQRPNRFATITDERVLERLRDAPPTPPRGDGWQWPQLAHVLGHRLNEACRVHHLTEGKRSAAVAALRAEVDALLAPHMAEILATPSQGACLSASAASEGSAAAAAEGGSQRSSGEAEDGGARQVEAVGGRGAVKLEHAQT